ncbi:MAG: hypothetical protein WC670_16175 [Pseudolabrys sp.]|jgi:hypothetical protein
MRLHPLAYLSNRKICTLMLLALTAGLLGGCETDGVPSPLTELAAYRARNEAPTAERPRRAQVAMDCWALAEKSHGSASLDAKADFVTKCIDGKMGTPDGRADAKSDGKPDAKTTAAAKPKPKPKQNAETKPAS